MSNDPFGNHNIDHIKARTASGRPDVQPLPEVDAHQQLWQRLSVDGDFHDGDDLPGWFDASIDAGGVLTMRYTTDAEDRHESQTYLGRYQLVKIDEQVGPRDWDRR